LSGDKTRENGFDIFRVGLVRRLSHTHYVAKNATEEGWHLVELKDGKWQCDCKSSEVECTHLYAARLHRATAKLPPEQFDESQLKCRYCGSPDVARCGFRYNARGIACRYRCNECQRKFSIPYVQTNLGDPPSELVWLLDQLGMLVCKLTELLGELNLRLGRSWDNQTEVKQRDVTGPGSMSPKIG
jgi:hypothetical protein